MNTLGLMLTAAKFASEKTANHPHTFENVFLEKYTELVVVECGKLLPEGYTHGPDGRHIGEVFKDHFGIQ